jgi:MoxR-like ATPase
MGPADVTSPDAVVQAMHEYDELGQDAFLAKYGFRKSAKFVVADNGRLYDSKALLAAAHGFQHPEQGPLPNSFSGGQQTTSRLEALGFQVTSIATAEPVASGSERFTREDCAVFDRYPKPVHWDTTNVSPEDQSRFKSIRDRLKLLASWLSLNTRTEVPLKSDQSLFQANGFSRKEIWSCIYPADVTNKSYAMQVALIISARGAEACICLGAASSQLRDDEKLREAKQDFQDLQERLGSVPAELADKVAQALPAHVAYRTSWLQSAGPGEFENLAEWLAYAAGKDGAQASISLYSDPGELERLGSGISGLVKDLADAAAPLFDYCYALVAIDEPFSDGAAQPSWSLSETVIIGGVEVNAEQISQAIEILQSTGGTAVKQPLLAKENPLAGMNYHQVAEEYLTAHPERAIPVGSGGQHAAHVKSAVLAYLRELLEQLGSPGPWEAGELSRRQPSVSFDAGELESQASAPPHQLEINPQVYRSIIAAIAGGKHVILTGPPGTAKTTLAEVTCTLAAAAGRCPGYVLTTATADWTTYDTIGGLSPAGPDGALEFRPGFFLDAARTGNWLVVDELNRSNFDRAFGQLFTVLSGQSVVLPYADPSSGRRIALVLEGSAGSHRYDEAAYAIVKIPASWRIIATMNVFDKSLLFEMSFALMRRFAFIEVPSPVRTVFESLWQRELEDLPGDWPSKADTILGKLHGLRDVKDIGPAVFIDMARFARAYVQDHAAVPVQDLAFQLFYSYLLPQFEGITDQQGRDLYRKARACVGQQHDSRLRGTLSEVLGVSLPAPASLSDEVDEEALDTGADTLDEAPDADA